MKKCLLIALIFLLFASNISYAQTIVPSEVTSASKQETDYQLPYPGLLPDSPLYFLKVTRDKIVGFLIANSLKRAEYNLLMADKRLNAGIYLLTQTQKEDLALSTISKGENYFEEAIQETKKAKSQGIEIGEVLTKLSNSNKKHQEIIQKLRLKSAKNVGEDLAKVEERLKNIEKRVDSLNLE